MCVLQSSLNESAGWCEISRSDETDKGVKGDDDDDDDDGGDDDEAV